MTTRRHWTEFPTTLLDLVQKFEQAPGGKLVLRNIPKNDAYSIRNEFHRFRRAVTAAIRDQEHDPVLHELYGTVRDMSLSMDPIPKTDLYQIVYRRQAISRYLDKWEASPPPVDLKTNQ